MIPARMKSNRLPGKPLLGIQGKSMLQRTFEQVISSVPRDLVFVATDGKEIEEECHRIGAQCVLTPSDCLTGTDRIAHANEIVKADVVVNVQGDEPVIPPSVVKKFWDIALTSERVCNGFTPIGKEDYLSVNIPKVVFDKRRRLLYMSRSPIPGNKSGSFEGAFKQVCVYNFTSESLKWVLKNPEKSQFEGIEDIEILRLLEAGFTVDMVELEEAGIAVDTQSDLDRVRALLA